MSYNNSRNTKSNYPTMSQSEWDAAPFNEPIVPDMDFDLYVTVTLSRRVKITTDNYTPECEDDGHIYPNTDNTDWRKEYENNCYAIPDLLNELEIYLKKDIESSKGNKRRVQRLNELLEACQGWNVDELEVEEL